MAFTKMDPPREYAIVAPYRNQSVPDSEWITVSEVSRHEHVRWSPDGNVLYFRSERDGRRCVWAQPLDPQTKRPKGQPVEVQHVPAKAATGFSRIFPRWA